MFNFKEITTFENNYIKDIENTKISKIYCVENGFTFEYIKNEKIESITIQIQKFNELKSYISIVKNLDIKKYECDSFSDVKTIYKIFYLEDDLDNERVEILYKNDKNQFCSYSLILNYAQTDFEIKKYEDIFRFKSSIIEDKEKTKLEFSYGDKYFYPQYSIKDKKDEAKRDVYGVYHLDYPICLGKNIKFEFDKNAGIKAYNLSTFTQFMILCSIETYNCMSKDEQEKLVHFLLIAQLYINSLFINTKLNETIFEDEEKLELLDKKLIEQNWKKEFIYANGEQGHPSTSEIYLYTKDEKKLIWFWDIEDYSSDGLVKLKFNDTAKDELNNYFKQINLDEFKKVEVWYEDNYEVQKHEALEYFKSSFNYTSEAIKYIEDKLTDELIHIIKSNKTITIKELIEGYRFGGTNYFLKNSKEGFSSWKFVEENAQLILDVYRKNEIDINQKVQELKEKKQKKEIKKTSNFYRILTAGAIATIIQRIFDIDSFSVEGFIFFMIIFSMVSYIWIFLFPNYENFSEEDIKKSKASRKKYLLIFKEYFKKFLYVVSILFILNIAINFISYKTGLFDGDFEYRFESKNAIALNIKHTPIKSFALWNENYFLYKKDNNYYLVKQLEKEPKKQLLTLYSKIYMDDIYDRLKDEKNFLEILQNISPAVYKEISIYDFIFKPLWFSNSLKDIYWLSDEIKLYTDRYNDYIQKKTLEEKEKRYKKLLGSDYKNMSEKDLFYLIKDIYNFYAFSDDTKEIMDMFIELETRPKEKLEGLNLAPYQFSLLTYLKFLEAKSQINEILKKQDKGVAFTFDFWDYKPNDLDSNGNSNLRFVDLKNDEKSLLYYDILEKVSIHDDKVYINYKNGKTLLVGNFSKNENEIIKTKLTFMINSLKMIDELYKKLNSN